MIIVRKLGQWLQIEDTKLNTEHTININHIGIVCINNSSNFSRVTIEIVGNINSVYVDISGNVYSNYKEIAIDLYNQITAAIR